MISAVQHASLVPFLEPVHLDRSKDGAGEKYQDIKVAVKWCKTFEIAPFSRLIFQLYLECLGGWQFGRSYIYCNKITNVAQVGK